MNKQEVFDKVVHHVLTQNARAYNGSCRYKTEACKECEALPIFIEDNKITQVRIKRVRELFPHMIWLSFGGEETHLYEMTDDHIHNAIQFIYTNGPYSIWGMGWEWLPLLALEQAKRGLRRRSQ